MKKDMNELRFWLAILFMVGLVLVCLITLSNYYSDKPTIVSIVSIRQNDSLNFVLGSGGTRPTYYTYVLNTDNKSYYLAEYYARRAIIFQDQKAGGYVESYPWHFPYPVYKIHVPENTIIELFSLR